MRIVIFFFLIIYMTNSIKALAQEAFIPVYKIQIEKSRPKPDESGSSLQEIRFLPAEREKYKFENLTTPFDKLEYREHNFDDEKGFSTKLKLNLTDENNQSVEYAKINFSKEIAPKIKFNSSIYGRQLFNDYEEADFGAETFLSSEISENHKLYFGQAKLSKSNNRTLSFMQMAEDSYAKDDLGLKLDGNYEKFDYSFGAYDSAQESSTDRKSAGGTAALKDLSIYPGLGSFNIGGGIYSSRETAVESDTYGIFSEYKLKRFTIKGEAAKNSETTGFSDNLSESEKNTWSVSNTYDINKNWSVTARHNQKVEELWHKNDFAIEYSAPKTKILDLSNVKFELNASYINDEMQEDSRKRFGFFTKYSF